MENFWAGFEKRAFLSAAARGLGYGMRRFRAGGSSLVEAAKALPAKIKQYPSKLHEAYLQGNVAAGNEMARAAGKIKKAPKAKKIPASKPSTPTSSTPPPGMESIRGKGKALLTGGLLGAGGAYMSGSGGQPQQPSYY